MTQNLKDKIISMNDKKYVVSDNYTKDNTEWVILKRKIPLKKFKINLKDLGLDSINDLQYGVDDVLKTKDILDNHENIEITLSFINPDTLYIEQFSYRIDGPTKKDFNLFSIHNLERNQEHTISRIDLIKSILLSDFIEKTNKITYKSDTPSKEESKPIPDIDLDEFIKNAMKSLNFNEEFFNSKKNFSSDHPFDIFNKKFFE